MGAISLDRFLEDKGTVSAEALARARRSGAETGQPLSSVLVNLGLISSNDLAGILAKLTGQPLVEADSFPIEPIKAPALSAMFLRRHKALPIGLDEGSVRLAMGDPTDAFTRDAIGFVLKRAVESVVAPMADLDEAIERLYFAEDGAESADTEAAIWADGHGTDAERLRELAGDAPIIKYVNRTVARAIDAGASDIHFEPMENRYQVRFRVDGLLRDVDTPPLSTRAAVTSRLKIMANLDIAERRLAQDGRFKTAIEGKEIDFRVSTTPTAFGESIVLRILDRKRLPADFAALGFDPEVIAPFIAAFEKPEGIILVTGPTGSGKTTTLFSALRRLNTTERKVLTVEDPIEYVLDGVNQVQVDARIGRTFSTSLRSFLRQDPDVIMVGEIRDRETAEIAVQASLTGHLVLSTLHTNSAAGALTRLLDMGIDDYLIASTLTVVIAQRLVRTLCPECREPYLPETSQRRQLKSCGLQDARKLYRGRGCATCSGAGYGGRSGIIEVLEISDKIRKLIQARADSGTIEAAARTEGMIPMFAYGLMKAAAGETTFEEVVRVTRDVS